MKNTLILEKRGCDFFHSDPINENSNMENYRVFGEFIDHNGVRVCGDFYRRPVYRFISKHGKPLKRPIKEHEFGLTYDLQYTDADGMCWRYFPPEVPMAKYRYCKRDILAFVNSIADNEYTDILIVEKL